MRIVKTFWKTEIEISPEEIRDMMANLPGDEIRGEFYRMLSSLFTGVSSVFKK